MSAPVFRTATPVDVPALVTLVTSAYRGESSRSGWTTEADLLDGARIDPDVLAHDIVRADSRVVVIDGDDGRPLACAHVAIEDGVGYFGMFAVDPTLQGRGTGDALLRECERIARDEWRLPGMRMTVIDVRDALIAFYVRRGYRRTGEHKPFPYGDTRFGSPRRDDLRFEVLEKTFVCATGELLPGEMRTTFDEITSVPIIVFNFDGDLYALEDQCSHEDFGLSSGGAFDTALGTIECVLHGAKFDVRDGRALCAPAYEPVAKFPTKIEHGGVWTRDDRD